MRVTGERVVTPDGGFGPTWYRHVAAYRAIARFMPATGEVLDAGCGVGHSYRELGDALSTVGVDVDPGALTGQQRTTLVADVRAMPFADDRFDAVVSVHSIEHVPDGDTALAELVRVARPGAPVVLVTPNRLTFAKADEIIDPYHYVEYDPAQLRALCAPFGALELHGLFGSERYGAFQRGELARLDRMLALDPLRVRRLLPRRAAQWAYDTALSRARETPSPLAAEIGPEDFVLGDEDLDACLDVVAVLTAPS